MDTQITPELKLTLIYGAKFLRELAILRATDNALCCRQTGLSLFVLPGRIEHVSPLLASDCLLIPYSLPATDGLFNSGPQIQREFEHLKG